jgi:hypothetical protein
MCSSPGLAIDPVLKKREPQHLARPGAETVCPTAWLSIASERGAARTTTEAVWPRAPGAHVAVRALAQAQSGSALQRQAQPK